MSKFVEVHVLVLTDNADIRAISTANIKGREESRVRGMVIE
jgi:hypothetical protein